MRLFVLVILAVTALVPTLAGPATAASFDWRWMNRSGHTVHVELYSQARSAVWPGNQRVWVVPPNRKSYSNRISCRRGEQICYGAWLAEQPEIHWGVGKGGKNRCTNCCWHCDGRQSQVIPFDLSPQSAAALRSRPSTIREEWVAEGGPAKVIIGSMTVELGKTSGKITFGNGKVMHLQRITGSGDLWTVNPPHDPILKHGTRLCGGGEGITKVKLEFVGKLERFLTPWQGNRTCGFFPLYEKGAYGRL